MTQSIAMRGLSGQSKAVHYTQAQLDQFIDAHERLVRGLPQGCKAILRYMQARGADLSTRLLSGADLTGADLQEARLVRTNFERALLPLADLRGADARDANFFRADIRGVSLRHADLTGAILDEADLSDAVLVRETKPTGFRLIARPAPPPPAADGDITFAVDFTGCSMKRASLSNARLAGANFTGALLEGADLAGADLTGSKFDSAVLTGVDLSALRVEPEALAHCVLDPSAAAIGRAPELIEQLAAAERWIATNGAEGRPAILDGEDLRPLGSALANRRLTAISAERARAISVDFSGAQLQGGRFDGADLRDADFTGADLRGASFRGAKLRHAKFNGADLRPLPLSASLVRAVDLAGADYAADCFAASRQA